MRTYKIALFLFAAFIAAGCGLREGYVPKEEYESLKTEFKQLQESSAATRDQYVEQALAMDDILQQLAQVSGSTVVLRTDVEHGRARITQAEQIERNISDIKDKLSQLEALTKDNASYRKLVSSLKQVIAEKEQEIDALKAEIQAKDRTIREQSQTITEQSGTISEQSGTIASQKATIEGQQERLRLAVQEQAQMLFQAGVDFEELGDQSPTVSRRRDKAKVKSLTREMYEKSILYYSKAKETGYPEAGYRINAVQQKMAALGE